MSPKRQFFNLAALALVVGVATAIAASTATGIARSTGKPVIGKPTTVPAQPFAGKRFTVSYKVMRAGTGVPLLSGRMVCDPSIAGVVVAHAESFKGGTARLSFVVPANAAGKLLTVKLTIKAGSQSATKVTTFQVQAASIPSLSVGDVTAAEGNSGSTTFSFPVTLSAAASQTVSVSYTTADGTAVAPSDYATARGTLTFQPGEKSKAIAVGVVGDMIMEQNELFTVTLSNPVNGTLTKGSATGTITNDDVAIPVTAGLYQGTEGNYVFLTVLPNRTVTGFRTNSLTEECQPGGVYMQGAVDWGTKYAYPIGNDGSFTAQGIWSGSEVYGETEYTNETWNVSGLFVTATSATGTFTLSDEINYKGTHYRCSTGPMKWSATLQK
jgi:hypothetical protein